MIPSHNTITALTVERDQYRRDFVTMSERAAELAVEVERLETQIAEMTADLALCRRTNVSYQEEFARLSREHASAVLEVNRLRGVAS